MLAIKPREKQNGFCIHTAFHIRVKNIRFDAGKGVGVTIWLLDAL
jgi:hypothetical protein